MKNYFLFPARFRILGLVLLIIGTLLGLYFYIIEEPLSFLTYNVPSIYSEELFGKPELFQVINNNITDEIAGIMIIVGGLFIGFSKEKIEDEFSTRMRLDSLVWAVYLNYIILVFMLLFIYGYAFLNIMLYNLFTIIYIFNFRYFYLRMKASK